MLLQGYIFSLALITLLLAVAHYRLTDNKISLILFLTLFCSLTGEFRQTFVIGENDVVNTFFQAPFNSIEGLILNIGILVLLKERQAISSRFFLSFCSWVKYFNLAYNLFCVEKWITSILRSFILESI